MKNNFAVMGAIAFINNNGAITFNSGSQII